MKLFDDDFLVIDSITVVDSDNTVNIIYKESIITEYFWNRCFVAKQNFSRFSKVIFQYYKKRFKKGKRR